MRKSIAEERAQVKVLTFFEELWSKGKSKGLLCWMNRYVFPFYESARELKYEADMLLVRLFNWQFVEIEIKDSDHDLEQEFVNKEDKHTLYLREDNFDKPHAMIFVITQNVDVELAKQVIPKPYGIIQVDTKFGGEPTKVIRKWTPLHNEKFHRDNHITRKLLTLNAQ